jgi:hypothetical protein
MDGECAGLVAILSQLGGAEVDAVYVLGARFERCCQQLFELVTSVSVTTIVVR